MNIVFVFGNFSIKMTNTPDGVVKLEIDQAQPSDCGAYKLVISNPNGENAALCAVAIKRMYFVLFFFSKRTFSTIRIKYFSDIHSICL